MTVSWYIKWWMEYIEEWWKMSDEIKKALVNLDNIQKTLEEHSRKLRDLSYKVDDLDFRFRRHEKAHQLSEEDIEDLYEEWDRKNGAITIYDKNRKRRRR